MNRRSGPSLLLSGCVWLAAVSAFLDPAAAGPWSVQVERGLLSVSAVDAPFEAVVAAVGARAGFDVVVIGEADDPLTTSFAGVPLDEGVDRLLRYRSAAVVREELPGRGGIAAVCLVGSSGGEVARVRAPEEEEAFGHWEGALVHAPDVAVREQALSDLSLSRAPRAATVMALAARDEDPGLRVRLTAHLVARGGDEAVRVLKEMLDGDSDPSVRLEAVEALGRMSDPAARQALGRALEDSDENVVATARSYLAQPSDDEAR